MDNIYTQFRLSNSHPFLWDSRDCPTKSGPFECKMLEIFAPVWPASCYRWAKLPRSRSHTTWHVNEYPTLHNFGNPELTQSMIVDSVCDFDWVFLEIPVKNWIVGMWWTCPIAPLWGRQVWPSQSVRDTENQCISCLYIWSKSDTPQRRAKNFIILINSLLFTVQSFVPWIEVWQLSTITCWSTALFSCFQMLNNYNNDAQVRDLMDHYDWHFLPVANPDGYDFTFSDVSDYTSICPPPIIVFATIHLELIS